MLIIPAIDLLGGQVVRLYKGDMDNFTVYSDNPVEMARKFADMGVKRLHIVDLDGAKKGETVNYNTIEKIAALESMEIEVGGGIRDMERLENYFQVGVNYAIIGTAAVKDSDFTVAALQKYPGRIILGIDARNGLVATDGWYEDSGIPALALAGRYAPYQVESIIYTDINKDGTLAGINLEETSNFAAHAGVPVIASGGLSSAEDIHALQALNNKNIAGCIVGKAYYEGRINLEEEIKRIAALGRRNDFQ